MKTLKKISTYLIVSLTVLVGVENSCFSFFNHSHYVIENTTNESKSDNTLTSDPDLSEVDVMLTPGIYTFNLYLSNQRVIISNFFFPQRLYYRIWQPPKIS